VDIVASDIPSGKVDLLSFTREKLAIYLAETFGLPKYRADQIFQWVYRKGVFDFSQMTDIAKEWRDTLGEHFVVTLPVTKTRQISSDGTRKYVLEVSEGVAVETVMIKQPTRMTLCVSSQHGCGMGCTFCRTGTMGFLSNLRVGDIIRQVLAVIIDAKNFDDMFQNVVFMGMGEPLHNFVGVTEAIEIMKDDLGLGIAPRKITVSTVGLVPAIEKFGLKDLGVNLAVSLNATTDEIRSQIMPINKAFPLEKLLGALRAYPLPKRKKITLEYVMLSGVNDSEADLGRLIKLVHGLRAKINLIPYNENAGLGFKTPSRNLVMRWVQNLTSNGVDATIRWSKGVDINAACGQLVTGTKGEMVIESLRQVAS